MTPRRSRFIAILAACVVLAGLSQGPTAAARSARRGRSKASKQPPGYAKAKKMFIEGVRLFDDGHYHKAITKFREALKHFRNVRIYARIALCYKWLSDNLQALEHYERFLKEFPATPTRAKDRKLRRKVVMEVRNLGHLVGRLRLEVEAPKGAEVRINGVVIGLAPLVRVVRLNPGPVNVIVMAKGYYAFRRDLKLAPNHSVTIRATLIKIKPKVIRIQVKARPVYKRWWFWTTIGALVAGSATALAVTYGSQDKARSLSGTPIRHDTLRFTW